VTLHYCTAARSAPVRAGVDRETCACGATRRIYTHTDGNGMQTQSGECWMNPDGSFVYPTQPPQLSDYGITSIVAGGTLMRDSYGPTKQAVSLRPIVIHTTRGEPSGDGHVIVDIDGHIAQCGQTDGNLAMLIGGWSRGTTRPSVARARDRRTAMMLRWAAQRKRRHG
jgi:hypothetical protein